MKIIADSEATIMVGNCKIGCYNATERLINDLTDSKIYSTSINPNDNVSYPLIIGVCFAIIKNLELVSAQCRGALF